MISNKQINVSIIAENRPRAASLSLMVTEALPVSISAVIQNLEESETADNKQRSHVCIVDLMSLDHPAAYVVQKVKENVKCPKIILLHVYKSSGLILPFYKMGIDGYLYCEPRKKDLIEAIQVVYNGGTYYPHFLGMEENT
jgi:DNA-binding NarL/FixJ family response regulator